MSKISNYLSSLVFDQLPEFVQDQYPLFTEFMTAYYQYLQQDKNAQDIIQNAGQYADIEKTIQELIPKFFDQYGKDIPRNIQADKALFIKNISDLYGAKGTENGYRLLFNLLFKEAIEFYYPYNNVIKPSDGKWISTYRLFAYREGTVNPYNFENTVITGSTSQATAVVSSVTKFTENRLTVYDLTLDGESIQGRFRSFERITARKLLRNNGGNLPYATVRDDLEDSEVYNYYRVRQDELRKILFDFNAGANVATRRLANLGIRYGWTEAEVLTLYNSIFGLNLDLVTWSRTTPKVNHPSNVNVGNSFTYYSNNPIQLEQALTENNAFEPTVQQRMITAALDFGWNADQVAELYNRSLGRSTSAAEWDVFLQPLGPVYEFVSAFLYPMLSDIDIVEPGLGYKIGEQVQINSSTGVGAIAEVYEVTSSGGIKNIRVLRPGLNYDANTQVFVPRVLGRSLTAEQTIQSDVATLKFQTDHGLKRGDVITIASQDFITTEANVVLVSVYAAGGDAADKTHGVYINESTIDVSNSNVSYNVSVYGETEKAFIDHRSFDLSNGITEVVFHEENLEAEQYAGLYNVIAANDPDIRYVNNLGNIGGGNVHTISQSNNSIDLNLVNIDEHTEYRFSGILHFVGQREQEVISIDESIGGRLLFFVNQNFNNDVTATTTLPTATTQFVSNLSYSSPEATYKIVLDLTKSDEYTISTDAQVTTLAELGISNGPVSILQPQGLYGAFGYEATDTVFGTPTDNFRSLTLNNKYSLENITTLYFEALIGGGASGDIPEASEELKLQYSTDGIAWFNIVSVSVNVTPNLWTLVTATVPQAAKVSTGVFLRFYQDGSNDLAAPRDTWVFTSVVNDFAALTTNYGRLEFNTGWIEHTAPNVIFRISSFLDDLDETVYVSNIQLELKKDPSLEMSNYLNSVTGNDIIVVHTWGDAKVNRLESGLENTMLSIGASEKIYSSDMFDKSAYILVGQPGLGANNGLEKIGNVADNDLLNSAELRFKIEDGKLLGENITVLSIPDYTTIQYKNYGPDDVSTVRVLLESVANLRPRISPLVVSEPFWKNNDGMLSEDSFVQGRTRTAREEDPVFYQQFSYVIRSEHPIDQWRRYAQSIMHPGGMQLFGELKLQTLPDNVNNLRPVAVNSAEVQDFFAITADKADRTHPESPDFRADLTFFPARDITTNPTLLEFTDTSHAVSDTTLASNYVTVECFFRKLPDTIVPPATTIQDIPRYLFSKFRSYELRTDAGRIWYRIQTVASRLYDWHWIDTGISIQYGVPYLLALTYDGLYGKLYINGTLVHRATNIELRRQNNNDPGVIANQNLSRLKINSGGTLPTTRVSPGRHAIGKFLVYDQALTEIELRENYISLQQEYNL
jgi:hypothetical protein